MTKHTTVPGCNIFELDYSNQTQPAPVQSCDTCGSAEQVIVEIDIESYAENHELDASSALTRQAAIQQLKDSHHSPDWLRLTKQFAEDEHFVTFHGPLTCTHQGVINPDSQITAHQGAVYIDDVPLSPDRSLNVTNHSPSGFAWGYGGSGPAQLALALLLEAGASDREAQLLHQDFKWAHIANLDKCTFKLPGSIVIDFLALYRRTRPVS